jgi:hypothetical protein
MSTTMRLALSTSGKMLSPSEDLSLKTDWTGYSSLLLTSSAMKSCTGANSSPEGVRIRHWVLKATVIIFLSIPTV